MSINLSISSVLFNPIKFFDVYEDISIELSTPPGINLVKTEVNKIIRRVNDEIGLFEEVISVTPGAVSFSMETMTATDIDDLSDNNIEEMGRTKHGWDFNTGDKRLQIADEVFEVLEVYVDEEQWELVDYTITKDSNNSSEKYWSQVGRYIFFPKDFTGSSEIVKIRVNRAYSFVNSVIDDKETIDVPENYRQLLISGVLYNLTSRPKFRDENIYAINKEVFELELSSLKNTYSNLVRSYERQNTIYKY